MYRRPDSVTAIGWFLSVFGFWTLLNLFYGFATRETPAWVSSDTIRLVNIDTAIDGAGVAIAFLCGVFILKGANWARWLYTVKWALFLIFKIYLLAAADGKFLPVILSIVIQGPMIVFLFLPKANDFFSSPD